ncbi:MAG: FG-GAP-like repeat-containing protein [Bacteroidales bacterium]|nr:FG-GAP-like repeat-containing protein [Bacteroidales bacterium]
MKSFTLALLFLLFAFNLFSQTFTEQTGISLTGGFSPSVAWGDYDSDGDQDILFTGYSDSGPITKIYKKNGNNTFTEQTDISLTGVYEGSVDWGDYDNDGDLDILLTGNSLSGEIAKIYKNNGDNTFTDQTGISLTGVKKSSAVWGDYDNDGDPDIIISGISASGQQICKIYRNDKEGQFAELQVNIPPFSNGTLDWGDYDNDGDPDILVTGLDYSGNKVAKIYNNNNNSFTWQTGISIAGVEYSTAAWGDYDNDGNLDILLAGNGSGGIRISKLYRNSGDNTFTEQTGTSLPGVSDGSVAWGDYDNDGDLDILLTGFNPPEGRISRIYKNNGDNTFTEQTEISLSGVSGSSVAWSDYDNDGDLDILLTGSTETYENVIKIYRNNCTNPNNIPAPPANLSSKANSGNTVLFWNRATDTETARESLTYNIVISGSPDSLEILSPMADLNTGYREVTAMGNTFIDTSYAIMNLDTGKYYWSVQTIDNAFAGSAFAEIDSFIVLPVFTDINADLVNVAYSSNAWGDYDNDGDLDILIAGSPGGGTRISEIYRNDGNDVFTSLDAGITGTHGGSATWGDYDNDDDLDILLSGYSDATQYYTSIWENNIDNTFTEQTGISLAGVNTGSVVWGDYDNDGDPDILLTGYNGINITKIYKNNGPEGSGFTEQTSILLTGVCSSSAAWGDYDNDGYLDIILCGNYYGTYVSKIYRNNTDNTFTEQTLISIQGISGGSVVWGDYDNDGDLDILLTGTDNNHNKTTKIYRNDGPDSLVDINLLIRGVGEGSAQWGDYDNDGDLDIVLAGEGGTKVFEVYRNDGNDIFTCIYNGPVGLSNGSVAWGDYDNDNDLDILVSGWDENYEEVTRVYRNNMNRENSRPTAPENLQAERYGFGISFNWGHASDDNTPVESLCYNLRVGTNSGEVDIIAPMSNVATGDLAIPQMGNRQLNTQMVLDSLPEGVYYWSVQAIDHSFLGGEWAGEQTFTITVIRADFSADTVCSGSGTNFTDLTITSGDPLTEWKWDFGDGNTSNIQNPVHTFTNAGVFTVQLIAISISYSDTITKQVIILPKPEADFTADHACLGTSTIFSNNTLPNGTTITSWYWDFGDGTSSDLQYPVSHGYINPGEYIAELTVNADNGCTDSTQNLVTVAENPVAVIASNSILNFCSGDSAVLSVDYDPDYLYTWKRNGTNLSGSDTSEYTAKISGDYTVEVINTSANCLTLSNTENVTVLDAPDPLNISNDGEDEFCNGDSVKLSVQYNSNLSYQWKRNGGVIGEDSCEYTVKESGNYSLTVANSNLCETNSSNIINIIVNPSPDPGIVKLSGPAEFCEGGSLTMNVVENSDYSYLWRNEYGIITDEITNSYTASEAGIYTLDISNPSGCVVQTNPVAVTVKPMPVTPVVESDNYLPGKCFGIDPIRLYTDNVPVTYTNQWLRNGILIPDATNNFLEDFLPEGGYSLMVDLNGCMNESNIFSINYENAPEKPELFVKGPVVWYMAASNDTAYQYRWYLNNELIQNADGFLYVANKTVGTYKVAIANEKGCFTMSDEVTIPITKSMMTDFFVPEEYLTDEDVDPFMNLKIYPNPTPGLFNIEMDNNIFGELVITIFTNEGRQILNIKFHKTTHHFLSEIDLSGQGSGVYLINLLIDRYYANRKVIIE